MWPFVLSFIFHLNGPIYIFSELPGTTQLHKMAVRFAVTSSSCVTARSSCLGVNLWSPTGSRSCVEQPARQRLVQHVRSSLELKSSRSGPQLQTLPLATQRRIFQATFPFVEPLWRLTCDCLQRNLTSFTAHPGPQPCLCNACHVMPCYTQ